jgi:hypothetical protein
VIIIYKIFNPIKIEKNIVYLTFNKNLSMTIMGTNENNINNLRNGLEQRVNNIANLIRTEKINFARELQSFLEEDNSIPFGCTLVPYNRINIYSDAPGFEESVLIDIDDPNSEYHGRIGLELPIDSSGYFVEIRCSLNQHNGRFFQGVAETSDEMYQMIEFCQSLLQWQPTGLDDLERVRIPAHLVGTPYADYLIEDHVEYIAEEHVDNRITNFL